MMQTKRVIKECTSRIICGVNTAARARTSEAGYGLARNMKDQLVGRPCRFDTCSSFEKLANTLRKTCRGEAQRDYCMIGNAT